MFGDLRDLKAPSFSQIRLEALLVQESGTDESCAHCIVAFT